MSDQELKWIVFWIVSKEIWRKLYIAYHELTIYRVSISQNKFIIHCLVESWEWNDWVTYVGDI